MALTHQPDLRRRFAPGTSARPLAVVGALVAAVVAVIVVIATAGPHEGPSASTDGSGVSVTDQREDQQEKLADCLDRLKPTDRELLHQKYFLQRSVAEIAAHCSKSVHSIYRSLSRVHDALLECMRRSSSA